MLNQGQWFKTKSEARRKADTMRKKGYDAYIRKYRYGKGDKNNGKGDLGWLASWQHK